MGQRKRIKRIVKEWARKQGHDQCWYYPELFRLLCIELNISITPPTITRDQFCGGCSRYQEEIFAKDSFFGLLGSRNEERS